MADQSPQTAGTWFEVLHDALRAERRVRSMTVVAADDPSRVGSRVLLLDPTDESTEPPQPRWFSGGSAEATDSTSQRATEPWANDAAFLRTLPAGLSRQSVSIDERSTPSSNLAADSANSIEIFVEDHEPPPKLVIIGAVHIASHLVHFAQRLGFHCVVVDARAAFATTERFGHADQLIVGWPGTVVRELPMRRSTYCVALTHDPKLDDPVLVEALRIPVRYVGALGSTRTHQKRAERLLELGVSAEAIATLDAPIGLALGGRRPEEIALAIAAKLVQVRAASTPSGNVG